MSHENEEKVHPVDPYEKLSDLLDQTQNRTVIITLGSSCENEWQENIGTGDPDALIINIDPAFLPKDAPDFDQVMKYRKLDKFNVDLKNKKYIRMNLEDAIKIIERYADNLLRNNKVIIAEFIDPFFKKELLGLLNRNIAHYRDPTDPRGNLIFLKGYYWKHQAVVWVTKITLETQTKGNSMPFPEIEKAEALANEQQSFTLETEDIAKIKPENGNIMLTREEITGSTCVFWAEKELENYIADIADRHDNYNPGGRGVAEKFCLFFSHAMGIYSKQEKAAAAHALLNVVLNEHSATTLEQHSGALTCGKLGDIYYNLWKKHKELLGGKIYRISDYLTLRRP